MIDKDAGIRLPTGMRGVLPTIACCWLAACTGDPKPQFSAAPELTINPNGRSPSTALVSFEANKPVKARYQVVGSEVDWEYLGSEFATDHRQPLVGLPIGVTYSLAITLIDVDGRSTALDEPIEVSLPQVTSAIDEFPQVDGQAAGPMAGYSILSAFRYRDENDADGIPFAVRDEGYGLLIALDSDQKVRWSLEVDYLVERIEQSTPTTLTLASARGLETIDFLGNRIGRVRGERQMPEEAGDATVATLRANFLHSGGDTLPNGNRLLLTTELRILEDYPTPYDSPVDPGLARLGDDLPAGSDYPRASDETAVVGDVVIEVSPQGRIVDRWTLFDLLDYRRSSYHGSLSTWSRIYPPDNRFGPAVSFTQASGIVYDAERDTIIVSVRYQSAIIGIDRKSGQLKWILGDPTSWKDGWSQKLLTQVANDREFEWPYYPSSVALTRDGDLLLVDGGGYRAIPPNEPADLSAGLARVLVLRIDESKMQIEQVFGYALERPAGLARSPSTQDFNSVAEIPGSGDKLFGQGYAGNLIRLRSDGTASEIVATVGARPGSAFKWGIADVLTTTNLLPPPTLLVSPPDIAVSTTQHESVDGTQESPPLVPDTGMPDLSVGGRWKLRVGDAPNAGEQEFTLAQTGRLVEGNIDDFPVVAWVQGNTFSMTVRREGSLGRVRLRYRGVINADGTRMEGDVVIDRRGTYMGSHVWAANKQ